VLIVTICCRLPVALFYSSEGPTKRYQALAGIVCSLGACCTVCQSNLPSVFTIQVLREVQDVRNASGPGATWWV